MIASEYRRYSRTVFNGDENGIPLWITVCIGTMLVMLFIYGLRILSAPRRK